MKTTFEKWESGMRSYCRNVTNEFYFLSITILKIVICNEGKLLSNRVADLA